MRTAIFGGTFDPVHNGHLYVLSQIDSLTDFAHVILVPVFIPPHKTYAQKVSDSQRIEMLNLAIESWKRQNPKRTLMVSVDDCEIRRKGTSYMYDTVIDINRRYDIDGKLSLVIGDDLVAGLSSWYKFDQLSTLVSFTVLRREAHHIESNLPKQVQLHYLGNSRYEASSSDIRAWLAEQAYDKLAGIIPESVLHYITEHGLYRN